MNKKNIATLNDIFFNPVKAVRRFLKNSGVNNYDV